MPSIFLYIPNSTLVYIWVHGTCCNKAMISQKTPDNSYGTTVYGSFCDKDNSYFRYLQVYLSSNIIYLWLWPEAILKDENNYHTQNVLYFTVLLQHYCRGIGSKPTNVIPVYLHLHLTKSLPIYFCHFKKKIMFLCNYFLVALSTTTETWYFSHNPSYYQHEYHE